MSNLPPVYIVSAVRTPIGSFLGYAVLSQSPLFRQGLARPVLGRLTIVGL